MKLNKTIAFVLCAIFAMPVVANASDEKLAEISETGMITIEGTTEEKPGTKVTFVIIKPGYSEEDIATEAGANSAVEEIYQNVVLDDYRFSYSYTLDPKAKSGNYGVSVRINGEDKKRTDIVCFNNIQNIKAAVDAINSGTDVSDVISRYKDDIDYATGVKYATATPGQKDYVASAIKAPVTEAGENSLTVQFKEYTAIALDLLSNAKVAKQNIKDAVENKYKKLGITDEEYTAYSGLTTSKQEVAIAYMADNYDYEKISTMSQFIELFKSAIKVAKDGTGAPKPTYGNTGSAGGGNSVGSIMLPGAGNMYMLDPPDIDVFTDLDEASWAKDAIINLAENGIVNGKGDKIFAPNSNITREEFVSIIVRAFQFSKADKDIKFTDVDEDKWYYNAVKTAYTCELVTGFDDNTFGVGSFITRQDMAVIIKRAVDASNMELYPIHVDKSLSDSNAVSDYAKTAVDTMINAGVINGYEDGTFRPHNHATRAQAAKIIYDILFK